MDSTRSDRGPTRRLDEDWLRRLALVVAALKKDGAEVLLDGLESASGALAKEQLRAVLALPRARRQALLAAEMGCRRDAAESVRAVLQTVPRALAAEMERQLPAYLAPSRTSPSAPLSGLTARLARRLVREAAL